MRTLNGGEKTQIRCHFARLQTFSSPREKSDSLNSFIFYLVSLELGSNLSSVVVLRAVSLIMEQLCFFFVGASISNTNHVQRLLAVHCRVIIWLISFVSIIIVLLISAIDHCNGWSFIWGRDSGSWCDGVMDSTKKDNRLATDTRIVQTNEVLIVFTDNLTEIMVQLGLLPQLCEHACVEYSPDIALPSPPNTLPAPLHDCLYHPNVLWTPGRVVFLQSAK